MAERTTSAIGDAPRHGVDPDLFPAERLAVAAAVHEASAAVAAALSRLAAGPAGLDMPTAELLVRLTRSADCGIRGVDVGQQCAMTPTQVSRLVDRAESAGLVERQQYPGDRRAQRVVLTTVGREAARAYAPLLDGVIDALMFDTLSAAERRTLVVLLERVTRRARSLLEPAG